MKITIGVDESGTGAWAGPFTVSAVALLEGVEDYLKEEGVCDSKQLSKAKRAELALAVIDAASATEVVFVEVPMIKEMGQAAAHFDGVKRAVVSVLNTLSKQLPKGEDFSITIIVDGKPIGGAKNWLIRGLRPRFEDKADTKYIAVSAASILAKHYRSERMQDLDLVYEGYGFAQHDGYGTADHTAVLESKGPTPEHRNIKTKAKSGQQKKQTQPPAETPPTSEKKKMAAKKTTKKAPAKKAATKKAAKKPVKATKAVEASEAKSERYSRDPAAMMMRLAEKIVATKGFAAHGIERAEKFQDKKALAKLNKATALLDKATAALA